MLGSPNSPCTAFVSRLRSLSLPHLCTLELCLAAAASRISFLCHP